MKIGIQGQPGSFTFIAAKKFYGTNHQFISYKTHKSTFAGLLQGEVDNIMVAFENSLIGSIHAAYDELHNQRIFINGEQFLPIHHQLLGLQGTVLSDILHVHSQAPALDQCRQYLETNLPHAAIIEEVDTSYSAELIARLANKSHAAIASSVAGQLHGLEVIAPNIEDDSQNFTRFLSLSLNQENIKGNKATIILTTNHQVGALGQALNIISQAGANLTKIESRPIISNSWQYNFIVDFTFTDKKIDEIIIGLTDKNYWVELLGIYTDNSKSADLI